MIFDTRLEVKTSSIKNAGNGVFAIDFIKKGRPVCYYAGNDVIRQGDEVYNAYIENNKLRFENTKPFTIPNYMDPYAMESLDTKYVRIGFREQEGLYGVGQLINDSCFFDPTKLPLNENGMFNLSSYKKMREIYTLCSNKKLNVMFNPYKDDKWILYATRDIDAGEELFLTYAHGYWETHFYKICEYPLHKVVALMDYGIEYVKNKDDGSSYSFMRTVGISNNGAIQQRLGVDPCYSESEKLSHIISKVIELSE